MKLTTRQRSAIRRSANQPQANIHIEVIPGIAMAPRTVGQRWGYETKGGSRIAHPSAYMAKGWSNMVYVPSTRRVIVGEQWVAQA